MPLAVEVQTTVNSVQAAWRLWQDGLQPGEAKRVVLTARLAPAADDGGCGPKGLFGLLGGSTIGGRESKSGQLEVLAEEARELEVLVDAEGRAEARGVSRFHFLLPGRRLQVLLEVKGLAAEEASAAQSVQTARVGRGLPAHLARAIPEEMWRVFVGPEHELDEWLADCPQDIVWAFQPNYDMLHKLWLNACFTLPSRGSPVTHCPNPVSRYCLELKGVGAAWLKSKKVKRHKNDFTISINKDFAGTFRRCERLHSSRGQGNWITDELVEALDRCRREAGEIKVFAVEMWEKSSGELAAAIMSFSVGDIFHDYSMATLKRDSRSPGAILSKVLGHLLCQAGYSLWYWGFKNSYMADYDEVYGGVQLANREFWPRWKAAREAATAGAAAPGRACDLSTCFPGGPGSSLDLATL